MTRILAWLRALTVIPRWMYILIMLLIWGGIAKDAWDWWWFTRPMNQCFEAHETVCHVGKSTLYIIYTGDHK
jgi:hypothetical protein